jgi:hypothetical protein
VDDLKSGLKCDDELSFELRELLVYILKVRKNIIYFLFWRIKIKGLAWQNYSSMNGFRNKPRI